jgi:hypothetical protein
LRWSAPSLSGTDRTSVMATLIVTVRLNDVDPQVWLADKLSNVTHLSLPVLGTRFGGIRAEECRRRDTPIKTRL